MTSRGSFKKGKKDGPWETFHKNRQVAQTGHYKMGQKDGLWKWFDEDGKQTRELAYYAGLTQD